MHAQSQEKGHTRARHELFSKLTRKQNDITDVVRMSSLCLHWRLALVFLLMILTSVEQ